MKDFIQFLKNGPLFLFAKQLSNPNLCAVSKIYLMTAIPFAFCFTGSRVSRLLGTINFPSLILKGVGVTLLVQGLFLAEIFDKG